MIERTLRIEGMHCKSCGILVSDAASEVDGVKAAAADFASGTLKVACENEGQVAKVKKAVESEGYRVVG